MATPVCGVCTLNVSVTVNRAPFVASPETLIC
jgi:hypothetical protein